MYWTLELASYLSDAPWPANKDELIDYSIRTGAPLEVVENLQAIEDEDGEIYESIQEIWPDFPTEEDYLWNEEHKNLKDNEIDGLIVIGGDGSFTGALKLKQEFNFPVVGIPGTIDNDLHGTSHTLGYDTALNTVMDAIDKIRDTAISHHRLFLVEVMGADAGYIALNSGLAIGAQEILIPEVNMSFENLINSLKKSKKSGKTSSIIVVAEGDKTGKNVFELASKIEDTLPKYETRVSVLGHIQRGGTPSCFDRVLGTQLGVKAVESLIEGNDGNMVGIDNGKIIFTPLDKALKGKSKINKELLRISQIMNT